MENIIAVYGTDVDRKYLLGYTIDSDPVDVQAYFEGRKGYGLEMEVVKPIKIPPGYAEKRKGLLKQRKQLENQIGQIDEEIELNGRTRPGH